MMTMIWTMTFRRSSRLSPPTPVMMTAGTTIAGMITLMAVMTRMTITGTIAKMTAMMMEMTARTMKKTMTARTDF